MKLFALIVALWLFIAGGDGCGAQDTPAEHVHSFGEWTITVAATCTDDGAKIRYCDCGEMQSETIAASHKEYILPAIDATCTESGLTKGMVCSACGEIYIAQQVTPPKAHVEQVIPAIESTCKENGLTEGKRCSSCDTILIAQQTAPLKAHTEVVDNGIAATCTSTGLTDGKHCSSCATVTVIQQTTPIIAHTYDDKYDENCNKCGFVRDVECAHNETQTLEGYAATCTSAGLTDGKQCKKCGEILTSQVAINIVPHLEIIDQVVEATCTSTGLTEGKHCSACSIILIAQTVISARGHSFSDWVTVKEATEAENGLKERYCDCGEMESQNIYFKVSEGLKFTSNGDGTCYVSDIGTCIDTDVVIPAISPSGDSVTSIGERAFNGCSSLTSVVITDSVTSIGDYAFYECSSLTSVVIPDSVTSIGYAAFAGCSSLTSVVIPDSVTSIGYAAFATCSSLTSVVIPDGVTSIGERAFVGCSSLTSVVIPDGVTSIGERAFDGCSSLTGVVIPDGVTSIGERAFYDCSSLTNIVIPNSVTCIGDRTFYNCTSLASIKVNSNNVNYKDIDGDLYTKDGKTLIQYAIGKKDTSFVIPDSVTSIGDRAFYNGTNLTSVVIGANVAKIGNLAFENCNNITNITYNGTEEQLRKLSVMQSADPSAATNVYGGVDSIDNILGNKTNLGIGNLSVNFGSVVSEYDYSALWHIDDPYNDGEYAYRVTTANATTSIIWLGESVDDLRVSMRPTANPFFSIDNCAVIDITVGRYGENFVRTGDIVLRGTSTSNTRIGYFEEDGTFKLYNGYDEDGYYATTDLDIKVATTGYTRYVFVIDFENEVIKAYAAADANGELVYQGETKAPIMIGDYASANNWNEWLASMNRVAFYGARQSLTEEEKEIKADLDNDGVRESAMVVDGVVNMEAVKAVQTELHSFLIKSCSTYVGNPFD